MMGVNESARRYRKRHPEKVKKATAKWFREHPDANRKYCKERYDREHSKKMVWLDTQKNFPCTDCGGKFPSVAMDFDHVRGVKHRNVGTMWQLKRETILAEIAKCELVCANCHRIRTWNRRHPNRLLDYTKISLPGEKEYGDD